jgi:hypothetical protein
VAAVIASALPKMVGAVEPLNVCGSSSRCSLCPMLMLKLHTRLTRAENGATQIPRKKRAFFSKSAVMEWS